MTLGRRGAADFERSQRAKDGESEKGGPVG